MAKLTLSNAANLLFPTTATINANNDAIEVALENTLSRDGTAPNEMNATLDMNSNRIINLPAPTTATEPIRFEDVDQLSGDINIINEQAADIPFTPFGTIAATNVQDAVEEVQTELSAEIAAIDTSSEFVFVQGAFSQANVQAAIDDAIATGRHLILPQGICFLTAPLVVNGALRMSGSGYFNGGTVFWLGTLNQNGFEIDNGFDVYMDNFMVQSITEPTAGSAFTITDSGVNHNVLGMYFKNIHCYNNYQGFDVVASGDIRWENCHFNIFTTPRGSQIIIDNTTNGDAGAAVIKDCTFASASPAIASTDVGVEIKCTGDIRIFGCNFVNLHTGLKFNIRSGTASGQVCVNGCTFDGQIVYGIDINSDGLGYFNIAINGNVFRLAQNCYGIHSNANAGDTAGWLINGNFFSVGDSALSTARGIYLEAGQNYYITGNHFTGNVAAPNVRGILINAACSNVNVAINNKITGFASLANALTNNSVSKTPDIAGWAAATGTATRTTFDTASVTLPVLAEHFKALIDDLKFREVL